MAPLKIELIKNDDAGCTEVYYTGDSGKILVGSIPYGGITLELDRNEELTKAALNAMSGVMAACASSISYHLAARELGY